jgi:hypothetical protein
MTLPLEGTLLGPPEKPYRAGRQETAIFVDVESLKGGGAIILGLVQRGRLDAMNAVLRAYTALYGPVRQTIVMTEVEPHLYIGILSGGPAKWLREKLTAGTTT